MDKQIVTVEMYNALAERISKLEAELSNKRDRGPASEREMTETDAYRVKFGDMKGIKHKVAAETLGISYGQVYSARGGYTFKQVKEDWNQKEQNKKLLEEAMKPKTPATQE